MQLVGSPLESVTAEHLDRVWPDTGPTVDCLVAHCGRPHVAQIGLKPIMAERHDFPCARHRIRLGWEADLGDGVNFRADSAPCSPGDRTVGSQPRYKGRPQRSDSHCGLGAANLRLAGQPACWLEGRLDGESESP